MAPVLRLGSATPRSQDRTPAPSATVDHSASAAPSAHPAPSAIPRERVRPLALHVVCCDAGNYDANGEEPTLPRTAAGAESSRLTHCGPQPGRNAALQPSPDLILTNPI